MLTALDSMRSCVHSGAGGGVGVEPSQEAQLVMKAASSRLAARALNLIDCFIVPPATIGAYGLSRRF